MAAPGAAWEPVPGAPARGCDWLEPPCPEVELSEADPPPPHAATATATPALATQKRACLNVKMWVISLFRLLHPSKTLHPSLVQSGSKRSVGAQAWTLFG